MSIAHLFKTFHWSPISFKMKVKDIRVATRIVHPLVPTASRIHLLPFTLLTLLLQAYSFDTLSHPMSGPSDWLFYAWSTLLQDSLAVYSLTSSRSLIKYHFWEAFHNHLIPVILPKDSLLSWLNCFIFQHYTFCYLTHMYLCYLFLAHLPPLN